MTPPARATRLTREDIARRLHDEWWNPDAGEARNQDNWRRVADAVLAMLDAERDAALEEAQGEMCGFCRDGIPDEKRTGPDGPTWWHRCGTYDHTPFNNPKAVVKKTRWLQCGANGVRALRAKL